MTFPRRPLHSNSIDGAICPPAINPVGVCTVTAVVPECPQEFPGTDPPCYVLVFVEGGKLLSIVKCQGIAYMSYKTLLLTILNTFYSTGTLTSATGYCGITLIGTIPAAVTAAPRPATTAHILETESDL